MWPANPFLELNRLKYVNEVWNLFECWKSSRRLPAENFNEVNDIAYRFVYDVVASKPLHCWANKFPMKRINPHRKSISDYCRLALHARAASFNVKAEVPINCEPTASIPSSSYDAAFCCMISDSLIHSFAEGIGDVLMTLVIRFPFENGAMKVNEVILIALLRSVAKLAQNPI